MRTAVGILVLSALVPLAGCSPSESATSSASGSSSSPPAPALTTKTATTVYKSFDKAYAAALTKADAGSYDRTGLAKVLSSPQLEAAEFTSRYLRLVHESRRASTKPSRVKLTYAAPAAAGADAVVIGTERSGQIEGSLQVLRRAAPDRPWTLAMNVDTALGSLPMPAEAKAAVPSTQERALARTIVRRAMAYVDGGSSSGLIPGAAVADVRDLDTDLAVQKVTKKTTFWGPAMKDVTAAGGPVVVFRTTSGLLILAAAETAVTVSNISGEAISYQSPFDRLFEDSGRHASMTNHYALVMAITAKDGAKPIVAGASLSTVMPPKLR